MGELSPQAEARDMALAATRGGDSDPDTASN